MFWGYKPTQSIFRPMRLGTFADSVDFRIYDDLRRHTGSSQNTTSASSSRPLRTGNSYRLHLIGLSFHPTEKFTLIF